MKLNTHLTLGIISSLSVLFVTTGCVPKNNDGTYNSSYSYHPYNTHKPKKQTSYEGKIRINNPNYQKENRYNQENNNYKRYQFNPFKQQTFLAKKSNNTLFPERIESKAKSLLGKTYKHGANGPHQYDCSSFTKHVFSSQGVTIPRTSKEQSKLGKFLRYSELKKGDLVFFNSYTSNDYNEPQKLNQ